jgi:hypothetical protein
MSFYTTKSNIVERDYVVIRHGIPNVNSLVMGVRFRDSWAVVERGSKTYHRLRQLPMLKNPEERPLSFLKNLPFITRPMDVKLIYGADVYAKYVVFYQREVEKAEKIRQEQEEILHMQDETKCKLRLESGNFCKNEVQHPEVTSYCAIHILKDPRLGSIDFKIPTAMTSKERKKLRKSAFNKLKGIKVTEEGSDVSMVEEQTPETEESTREEA